MEVIKLCDLEEQWGFKAERKNDNNDERIVCTLTEEEEWATLNLLNLAQTSKSNR